MRLNICALWAPDIGSTTPILMPLSSFRASRAHARAALYSAVPLFSSSIRHSLLSAFACFFVLQSSQLTILIMLETMMILLRDRVVSNKYLLNRVYRRMYWL